MARNREMAKKIQEHIYDYSEGYGDMIARIDQYKEEFGYNAGKTMVEYGTMAVYYDDQRKFLEGLYGKGKKEYSDQEVFDRYVSLINMEVNNIYNNKEGGGKNYIYEEYGKPFYWNSYGGILKKEYEKRGIKAEIRESKNKKGDLILSLEIEKEKKKDYLAGEIPVEKLEKACDTVMFYVFDKNMGKQDTDYIFEKIKRDYIEEDKISVVECTGKTGKKNINVEKSEKFRDLLRMLRDKGENITRYDPDLFRDKGDRLYKIPVNDGERKGQYELVRIVNKDGLYNMDNFYIKEDCNGKSAVNMISQVYKKLDKNLEKKEIKKNVNIRKTGR